MKIGDLYEVEVSGIAHGGHSVARFEGRVIFIRHTIPGEKVKVLITEVTKSFARGDAVAVIQASPFRVTPPCEFARPGGCGGCDFQHITSSHQRKLKSEVIQEQFRRIAKKEIEVEVEEVLPTLGWRTRMEFTSTEEKKPGLFLHRSNQLLEITGCLIADPDINLAEIGNLKVPPGRKVHVSRDSLGRVSYIVAGREDLSLINEKAGDRTLEINPRSFWQSHDQAPEVLVAAVKEFAQLQRGDHLFDLYGGVGLFTAALIDDVGLNGRITLMEWDENAITDARRNFASDPQVEIVAGRVEDSLKKYKRGDLVLLDPPRAGAGAGVIAAIVRLAPRAIIYVACDPASLARDTGYLESAGYHLTGLKAFDLFPMTHHIESVACFMPRSEGE
jgi:tRNA/tmRNA/rRNA uracil-C5-methylase (TrmA/RlmC/RlmD family)